MQSRRDFIALSTGIVVTGVAGCQEDSSGTDDAGTEPADEAAENTQTPDEDATSSEAADSEAEINEGRLSSEAYPTISLNWLYHHDGSIEEISSMNEDWIPDRVQQLQPLSVAASYPVVYEEYQTEYAAKQRVDLSNGDTVEVETDSFTVVEVNEFEDYPTEWYFLENNHETGVCTRAGALVAFDFIDTDEYIDTAETIKEQIRTKEPPQGDSLSILETLSTFANQYGRETLDLATNNALATPMDEFSSSTAKDMLIENYEYATEESIYGVGSHEIDEFPIDAYDSYQMSVNEGDVDRDIGSGMQCEVTSWHSQEYATEYARSIISETDWAFRADHELPRQACRFFSDDGTQQFDRVGIDLHSDPFPVTDTYSGNVTIVLRPFVN